MTHLTLRQSNIAHVVVGTSVCVMAIVAILWTVLSAQARQTDGQAPRDHPAAIMLSGSVITIGVAGPLNVLPFIFWPVYNSAQLAVSQTNAAGGITTGGITYTIVLVTADDSCNPTQAISAANTLMNAGAVAIIGHICSSTSMAAQPIYNAAGISMVSPASTNPQLTQQGYTTTFRTISLDSAAPDEMAIYLRQWAGITTTAIVENINVTWGTAMGDVYSSTFTAMGGSITSRHRITSADDFTATLTALNSEHAGAIFYLDDDATRSGLFSRVIQSLGITDPVIAWNPVVWDDTSLLTFLSSAGAAAEGNLASMSNRRTADMPGWPAFLSAYQEAHFTNFGTDPGMVGAYAYDAAGIIIAAMGRTSAPMPWAVRDQIATTSNYGGVVGKYESFDGNGDVMPQMAWLSRVRNGQWISLHPSNTFLPFTQRN